MPSIRHSAPSARVDRDRSEHVLLLSDFGGHPFTTELANCLARRGTCITYTYCPSTISPKGLAGAELDAVPVAAGMVFEKYRPAGRIWSEVRYGLALARVVWSRRPDTHVVCNMPLVSALVVWLLSIPLRVRFVVWFQDVQSGLAATSLGDGWMSRALSLLETFVLRRAAHVIAISPELAEEAIRRGVASGRVSVMENWAPIERLPMLDPDTSWLREIARTTRPLFVYSGTLARKHEPSLLLDLARSIGGIGGHLIVVTEGEGADVLRDAIDRDGTTENLTLLPYQPFDRLPEVLASADVLVVILEQEAGRFSVPSKTLSYLCAGRAVLGSIASSNAAARLLTSRADAGLVAEPGDRQAFCTLAVQLAVDDELRRRLGANGRRFAEANFSEDATADAFLAHLGRG